MPVYEFICQDCNRVFSFLARTLEAATRQPVCPRCGRRHMRKLFSRFASVSRSGSPGATHGAAADEGGERSPQEEARMERAMMSLARDVDKIDESDPRQLAGLMRRLSDATGEPVDEPTREMICRLEAGEDPDEVEEKLGDSLPEGGPDGFAGAPTHDNGLYEL